MKKTALSIPLTGRRLLALPFVALPVLAVPVQAADYDYPYLTVERQDGATGTFDVAALTFATASGVLTLSSDGSALTAADLQQMYFAKAPTVSIPDAGWVTLYSDCTLDLSALSSTLTAYIATFDSEKAQLTPVTMIPAHTGIIIKGTPGDYTLPVATWAAATATNDLAGTATGKTVAEGEAIYALTTEGTTVVFSPVAQGVTVPAGKAYYAAVDSSRPYYAIDGTTAITTVATDAHDGEATVVYNLSGQRVNNPRRGVYIVNGRKVIMK